VFNTTVLKRAAPHPVDLPVGGFAAHGVFNAEIFNQHVDWKEQNQTYNKAAHTKKLYAAAFGIPASSIGSTPNGTKNLRRQESSQAVGSSVEKNQLRHCDTMLLNLLRPGSASACPKLYW